ncbi:unnamed protein product [Protopolystoma xenopodis]|uniref:Uncharacterized protein n=1 Tax=Protopolystoma xenopodis TaxID=117903 RepID=A0A448WX11_9PLAT|nr:unnamed protein product [Protopolystoma xenopodis]
MSLIQALSFCYPCSISKSAEAVREITANSSLFQAPVYQVSLKHNVPILGYSFRCTLVNCMASKGDVFSYP